MRRHERPRLRRDERGAATIFVLGLSIVLFACAGLVIDGGLAIGARQRAADDAEQAARVATDSIDVAQLRETGEIVVDRRLAEQRAAQYLVGRGYAGNEFSVQPQPNSNAVRVVVRNTTSTLILGVIGISQFDVTAAATSEPDTGP